MVCGQLSVSEQQRLMAVVRFPGFLNGLAWCNSPLERNISVYETALLTTIFFSCLTIEQSHTGHNLQPCPTFEKMLKMAVVGLNHYD